MKNAYYAMVLMLIVALVTLGCSDNLIDETAPGEDAEMTAAEIEEGQISKDGEVAADGNKEDEPVTVADYQQITPEAAVEKMAEDDGAVLIDVRTREEYDSGHIEGSILLPLDVIADDIEAAVPDKETEIIVYCRSGNRSRTAASLLLELGYQNVYDLGGIIDWPYDIVTE